MALLNNGLSGMQASQYALDAVGQNVANINTDGYSRQEAVMVARTSKGAGHLNAGDGVEVTHLRRVSDDYHTAALWRATSQQGYDDLYKTAIGRSESSLSSKELSVSGGLDSFFTALNAATDRPQSIAPRQQIIASANALAVRFRQLAQGLDIQKRELNEQADVMLKTTNTDTKTLAKLNRDIVELKAKGDNISALEDQRDNLILKMSKRMEIRAHRNDDGSIDVSLKSGQPLVLGSKAAVLSRRDDKIILTLDHDAFEVHHFGGSLGANRDYLSGKLAQLHKALDSQAKAVATSINDKLKQGFDLNGNPGKALFSFSDKGPAASMMLADGFKPEDLAFIGSDGQGKPAGGKGNNSNLLAINKMKNGFFDAYTGLLGSLAVSSGQAQAKATASTSLRQDALNQRDSVSAVNQDEEAAKLMKFTQAYQSNAKVISAADHIFNTLMEMF
ncbi:flagellar hook-associated protein FlgK [Gallaecimonas mangrovi]|uniref:flagellar hook-associated protein FlgK n=1 Tax=Gallaecimonas mangrovi TaxID=2291597 RepID=UPI000E20BEF3|nr:flagellar hook-associated protein FlgK [Gallaecimonas mangrovi]